MTQSVPPMDVAAGSVGPEGEPWSLARAAELYGIDAWSNGYFSINERGHVAVDPAGKGRPIIDLKNLVDEIRQRDLYPPLLLRFTDILDHRLAQVHGVFQNAMRELGYQGDYRCVYPIKVNQQRQVVEEILRLGQTHGFGLEAGSKPELLAVMALVEDNTTPIICNGFKDDEFIEAVILSAKIGRNIIPVVEKFSELKLIAKYAKAHDVKPSIGIRVKLAARGAGRWESSGGERSKFGLFISEVLDAVEFLRAQGMTDCLRLLHVHLGSQISNIQNIKAGLTELSRVYVELQRAGADLRYIDVGGGLGVDYDGSNSNAESSINYTLQEYANDVVYHIRQVCDAEGMAHPTIISESGRALVAYHSVLVFNVLGSSGFAPNSLPQQITDEERADMPQPVWTLYETWRDLSDKNYNEFYHDAIAARDQTMSLFNLGYCSLAHRALAEKLYYAICVRVVQLAKADEQSADEFRELEHLLCDTYFCNLSIFQSLPDSWAIDQLFPIMPIHRLNEAPTRQGLLADITCDSDGKIDRFITDGRRAKPVLELHPLNEQDYDLAVFLVGAYQEILGDLHNLFGDTHAVHIRLDEDGQPAIEEVVEGDTVREVLNYVQFSADDLKRTMRRHVEQALRRNQLTLDESKALLRFYENGLEGYTYLE